MKFVKNKKNIVFVKQLLFLFLFSCAPAFACDPSSVWTVALPVFAIVLVIKIMLWPKNIISKIIFGLFGAVLIFIFIAAGPFSVFIYIWVLYEVIAGCMEFLLRSEKTFVAFYQNYKRRVWTAGSLLIGGVIAKIIYYSLKGFSHFLFVYRINFGYFIFWLALGVALLAIALIFQGIKLLFSKMRKRRSA